MSQPSLFLCLFLLGTSVTASESPVPESPVSDSSDSDSSVPESPLAPAETENALLGLLFRLLTAVELGKYSPIVPRIVSPIVPRIVSPIARPPDENILIGPFNPYSPLLDPTQTTYEDQTDGMMDQVSKKGLGGKKENFFQFGGKRASFNKYQGKRSSFNKYQGKRSSFNRYQGKRFSKYGGKRGDESSPDGEAKESFYQFGGKRGEKFK